MNSNFIVPPPPPLPITIPFIDFCNSRIIQKRTKQIHLTTLLLSQGVEKSSEFLKLFPSIPQWELLFQIFKCNLEKESGKLWISEFHLCFKLNWPGKSIAIFDFSDIVDIILLQSGTISVFVERSDTCIEYHFDSFYSPQEAYEVISKVWSTVVDPQSLFRRRPDLSNTPCVCENYTCDVCFSIQKQHRASKPSDDLSILTRRKSSSVKKQNSGFAYIKKAFSRSETNISLPDSPRPSHYRSSTDVARKDSVSDVGRRISTVTDTAPAALQQIISSPAVLEGNTLLEDEPVPDCQCGNNTESQFVFETTLPFTLPILWKEMFCITSSASNLSKFLLGPQKLKDLEWSAWLPEGDPGLEVLVPDSQAGGGDFEPTFESLKVGLTRRTSRSNALNHGIPFFPKSAQSVETITIKSVSKDKICLVNEATLDMLGVITIVDICLESKESETTMKIYAKAIFSGNGKYSVPKSLAEKPTIDGVKAYYSELCVWLNEHISLQPTPSIRYSHHHFEKDEFKPVHESILPFSIDTLWNEWFNIPGTGNTFTNYLLGPEKVQNLEIGPWVLNNPTEMDKLLPLGHRENGMYHPDLTSLQEGYERKTTRNNPLNHGLPFIPKTAQNIESFKIIHRDDDTLCVFTDAHLPVMGIITQCHVCLVQLSPSQTQLKAYMKVIFTGKGKYPVPKALAEKSAIEGVALFYQNLTQYFIDSIVESPLGAEQMCECVQLEKDGYKTVLETEIHVPIAVLWLETFAVSSQPNTFSTTFTVTGAAKWTELEYSKFVKKEEQDAPLVPLSQCSDPQYRMAFKDLQVGMKRKAQYLVPLKHGIPFVPKTMLNTSNDHVHDVTPHRVCFHSEAFVADVGVSTLLRICYTACTSTRTRVHVQTKIVCGKGKYPVPKALAEKSGYETVTSLYDELYKICNQTLAGPDQPQSKPKSETKPIVVTPTQTFTQWTRTLPREYLVLSIVILMVLMFMNCIILWFLFLVTERTNQRLDVIVAVIKTLKAELNQ